MPVKHPVMLIAALLTLAACGGEQPAEAPEAADTAIDYPETETVDHTDSYHGVEVADPYRWLEEDVRESERVERWVDAQNAVTFAYLEDIPERDAIAGRMRELWDYERYGQPVKEGGRYYYSYNDGLQNQDVIYVLDELDALLLDVSVQVLDVGFVEVDLLHRRGDVPEGEHAELLSPVDEVLDFFEFLEFRYEHLFPI